MGRRLSCRRVRGSLWGGGFLAAVFTKRACEKAVLGHLLNGGRIAAAPHSAYTQLQYVCEHR